MITAHHFVGDPKATEIFRCHFMTCRCPRKQFVTVQPAGLALSQVPETDQGGILLVGRALEVLENATKVFSPLFIVFQFAWIHVQVTQHTHEKAIVGRGGGGTPAQGCFGREE